jgi:outer membrane protein OmpA-like peptidoglycan-associated protein
MRRVLVLGLLLAIGACATPAAPSQRYAVYFQLWSTSLDDSAKQVIASAATRANENPALPVEVAGYADPEGSPQVNRDLSRTRAQMVADELTARGVAGSRINITAHGSIGFIMDSQEARRVVITLGQP